MVATFWIAVVILARVGLASVVTLEPVRAPIPEPVLVRSAPVMVTNWVPSCETPTVTEVEPNSATPLNDSAPSELSSPWSWVNSAS